MEKYSKTHHNINTLLVTLYTSPSQAQTSPSWFTFLVNLCNNQGNPILRQHTVSYVTLRKHQVKASYSYHMVSCNLKDIVTLTRQVAQQPNDLLQVFTSFLKRHPYLEKVKNNQSCNIPQQNQNTNSWPLLLVNQCGSKTFCKTCE